MPFAPKAATAEVSRNSNNNSVQIVGSSLQQVTINLNARNPPGLQVENNVANAPSTSSRRSSSSRTSIRVNNDQLDEIFEWALTETPKKAFSDFPSRDEDPDETGVDRYYSRPFDYQKRLYRHTVKPPPRRYLGSIKNPWYKENSRYELDYESPSRSYGCFYPKITPMLTYDGAALYERTNERFSGNGAYSDEFNELYKLYSRPESEDSHQ